ncbi:hypothetical protein PBRA_005653 [Plasmodiophora brassicae]|uniref:Legumain n=1 Tax=Plasmodiophora brassicae TaxID=37360 RepID=A0A0G4IPG2_PLABS|nr:hypothetical protein PBRA_005653 [Plasmodiophora brassicae]
MASALLFAAAVVVLAGSSMAAGTHWALLAAGSDGYWNYRHQADLCHAFQLLTKEGGIPASNVVTMFKDDVAYDAENPVKGELINRPGGPNVYEGVVKDYTGDTVNANNFLHVLKGDADAVKTIGSGRVVESGPEDTLFIAYFDHGATGLVGMPDGSYLYGSDLVDSLKDMYENGKFKRAVIFIEACESGSMVDGILPTYIDVFVATAAGDTESSYAYYFDEPGKHISVMSGASIGWKMLTRAISRW